LGLEVSSQNRALEWLGSAILAWLERFPVENIISETASR